MARRWPTTAPVDGDERFRLVFGEAFRAAFRLLKERSAAEDVAQDVCLEIERFLERYANTPNGDELRDFRRWVRRVAANRALNVYRSRWHAILRGARGDQPARATPDNARPDELVATRQLAERARVGVEELPDAMRQAFTLYYLGHSYPEIARQLEAPVGTVKVRVHRARQRLATWLQLAAPHPEGSGS